MIYLFLCALLFIFVYVCDRVSDPLELELRELQAAMGVLAIEPGSSRRAARALIHWAISPAQPLCFKLKLSSKW